MGIPGITGACEFCEIGICLVYLDIQSMFVYLTLSTGGWGSRKA